MPKRILTLALVAISLLFVLAVFHPATPAGVNFDVAVQAAAASPAPGDAGALQMVAKSGQIVGLCPLKHTDVQAGISGFIARVNVTQEFVNPSSDAIEAVYTFPLPQDSAVDDMTITIGTRTIRSDIKRREEAQKIYAEALQQGKTAALLNQQRPNIFVQRVGNIAAGESVRVYIAFSSRLKYEDGTYEFAFPMVVAPRYIPGQPVGANGGGFSPDTAKVPDASEITPQPVRSDTRAGHDISMSVLLDAGVPIHDVTSVLHDIDVERPGSTSAIVRLKNQTEIPNRDFILRYKVAGAQISEGMLTHVRKPGDGYFSLVLQPPERFPEYDVTPKELVFLVDTSGSMSGFPIETGKKLIHTALDELYPGDTFNLITFSGDTRILFPQPVYPSAENVMKAKAVLNAQRGWGGTEMMTAIRAALTPSDASDHVRVVCFVTDGEVGNDMEIISEVQKHPNARVFAFGIGNSVNRFLLDKVSQVGRGEVQYVTLQENASAAAKKLYEHLRSPLLTDVTVDWGKLPVKDVYPVRIPDVFAGRPVVITGRFDGPATGTIRITGKRAGQPYEREVSVNLPAEEKQNAVLASLWAREQIDQLMSQDWRGAQVGDMKPQVQEQVTRLGLDYRLLTQFTAFVAVEDRVVNRDGNQTTIEVPVEMPDGMDYNAVFGGRGDAQTKSRSTMPTTLSAYANMVPQPSNGLSTTVNVAGAASPVMSSASQTVEVEAAPEPWRLQPSLNGPPVAVNPNLPQVGGSGGALDEGTKKLKTPSVHARPMERKVHPTLVAQFDCWQKSQTMRTVTCALPTGPVAVELIVTSNTAEVLEGLAELGFKRVGPSRSGVLRGTIAVENLEKLSELDAVRFVGPAPLEAAKK